MPSVAATAACDGFRPVANAFGDRIRDDVDARHRELRALRKLRHHLVQRMARTDFFRAIHREDDAVREPVRDEVRDGREQKRDDQPLGAAKQFADQQEQAAQHAEQQRRFQSVGHVSGGTTRSVSFYRQNSGPRRSAARNGSDSTQHVLVARMRSAAFGAKAI